MDRAGLCQGHIAELTEALAAGDFTPYESKIILSTGVQKKVHLHLHLHTHQHSQTRTNIGNTRVRVSVRVSAHALTFAHTPRCILAVNVTEN